MQSGSMSVSVVRRSLLGVSLAICLLFLFGLMAGGVPAGSDGVAAPTAPLVDACAPIVADTIWSSGVYTGTECEIVVPAGVTLTIQAGVVVKLGSVHPRTYFPAGSTALIVDGTLIVQGTAGQPVVFTSLKDDTYLGDTNGDGDSVGTAGDWYGLVFRSGSVGRLEHFFVGYAGSGAANRFTGYNRAQIDVKTIDVQLRQGVVTDGRKKGIYLEGADIMPLIEGVHIARNNDPSYGQPGYAIYQDSINMQPMYSALTFSGNDWDEVFIGNLNTPMTQSVTLGGTNFGFTPCGSSLCLLTVPNGITLTVNPGTLLDLGEGSYAGGITVAAGGSLIAQGTVTQPITFTSRLAEASGGTTHRWIGLWAQQGSTLRLDQCDISYASDTNFGLGGLEINTNTAEVSNCRIHHNAQNGLYLYSRNGSTIHPMLENVDVTDNGQAGVFLGTSNPGSLFVTWDGGNISRNGYSGVVDSVWNDTIYPTLRNLTISSNGSLGIYDDRKQGISFSDHNVNPVLEDIAFTDNVGTAVSWYCNGSITAKDLTATGNGGDELLIPGCALGSGRQWDLGEAGIPVRVTGSIEVSPNGLLSIKPGTTLAFDKNGYGSPTYISVKDQGALYALGTVDKPVVFTGARAETGWWAGIGAVDRSTVSLGYCQITYGGATVSSNLGASLELWWGLNGGAPTVNVQNCEIAYSGRKGVHFNFNNNPAAPVVFQNNSIHDTAQEGVANWNAPLLDARNNWWGDASGPYHPTLNPSGLGDNVGDNITVYPWLGMAETGAVAPGQMLVTTGGPNLVSPGQTVDYAVQYLNTMTETVKGAVLAVQLPQGAEYVDSPDGVFWIEKNQVFWALGDLTPGAQGFHSFRVRFQWGLPASYKDGTLTLFAGSNYNMALFDVAEYLDYSPVTILTETPLTPAEFAALRAAHPDLETLYTQAIEAGYTYLQAGHQQYSDGSTVDWAAMRTADRRSVRLLTQTGEQSVALTSQNGSFRIHDTTGGLTIDLTTMTRSYWGDWMPEDDQNERSSTACSKSKCIANCTGRKVTFKVVTVTAFQTVLWTIGSGGTMGPGAVAFHVAHVSKMVYDCVQDCDNPATHCCTDGQVRWSPSGWNLLFGPGCAKEVCVSNSFVGQGWVSCPGQRCVAGIDAAGGCKNCDAKSSQYREVSLAPPADSAVCASGLNGGNDCTDTGVWVAKDPNAIYGPSGDMLPEATALYTITYENEGLGRAYGVYVTNLLPEVFDAASLDLHGAGTYLPDSREIFWMVGELGPKGAVDSEGAITYTVNLTGGLPSGTVVSNQAVVFFPSVPEETPTNTWVNLISPLKAIPQNLTTEYMTPLSLTLAGQEVSGLPLTFEIGEAPHGGTLTGTPPSLVYTPLENFTGPDSFSFRVSNGTSTSRAAQVSIEVTSVGDATPPQVVWTSPGADAKDVIASASPAFTGTAGPVYAPVIVIGVSEPLSETTVSTATVTLTDRAGKPVTGTVRFDGAVNQIVFSPLVVVEPDRYTVTVGTGVTDVAGNVMAAPYMWTFEIKGATPPDLYLPMLLR
ncbi:MAG: Ig-like domain-containing protein [Caldilineaceae bacterium]|nr:Ig-like domain-containing protein [Caldilineaceae bacterium]